MNKAELIEKIAKDINITKAEANKILDSFISIIIDILNKGDKVTLMSFGTFNTSKRSAHTGINPQTGAILKIKARRTPKFKASKNFVQKISKKILL